MTVEEEIRTEGGETPARSKRVGGEGIDPFLETEESLVRGDKITKIITGLKTNQEHLKGTQGRTQVTSTGTITERKEDSTEKGRETQQEIRRETGTEIEVGMNTETVKVTEEGGKYPRQGKRIGEIEVIQGTTGKGTMIDTLGIGPKTITDHHTAETTVEIEEI